MSNHQQPLHPMFVQALLDGKVSRQLYRSIFIAKVHPDPNDISTVAVSKFTVHSLARDMDDARQQIREQWDKKFGGDAELIVFIACAPVPGESIEEESMWIVEEKDFGPRAVTEH
jgi:hypothetical protein